MFRPQGTPFRPQGTSFRLQGTRRHSMAFVLSAGLRVSSDPFHVPSAHLPCSFTVFPRSLPALIKRQPGGIRRSRIGITPVKARRYSPLLLLLLTQTIKSVLLMDHNGTPGFFTARGGTCRKAQSLFSWSDFPAKDSQDTLHYRGGRSKPTSILHIRAGVCLGTGVGRSVSVMFSIAAITRYQIPDWVGFSSSRATLTGKNGKIG